MKGEKMTDLLNKCSTGGLIKLLEDLKFLQGDSAAKAIASMAVAKVLLTREDRPQTVEEWVALIKRSAYDVREDLVEGLAPLLPNCSTETLLSLVGAECYHVWRASLDVLATRHDWPTDWLGRGGLESKDEIKQMAMIRSLRECPDRTLDQLWEMIQSICHPKMRELAMQRFADKVAQKFTDEHERQRFLSVMAQKMREERRC